MEKLTLSWEETHFAYYKAMDFKDKIYTRKGTSSQSSIFLAMFEDFYEEIATHPDSDPELLNICTNLMEQKNCVEESQSLSLAYPILFNTNPCACTKKLNSRLNLNSKQDNYGSNGMSLMKQLKITHLDWRKPMQWHLLKDMEAQIILKLPKSLTPM